MITPVPSLQHSPICKIVHVENCQCCDFKTAGTLISGNAAFAYPFPVFKKKLWRPFSTWNLIADLQHQVSVSRSSFSVDSLVFLKHWFDCSENKPCVFYDTVVVSLYIGICLQRAYREGFSAYTNVLLCSRPINTSACSSTWMTLCIGWMLIAWQVGRNRKAVTAEEHEKHRLLLQWLLFIVFHTWLHFSSFCGCLKDQWQHKQM